MKIWVLLVALSCLLADTARGNGKTYSEKIREAGQAVVEILVAGQRQGTGFCVSSNGYIVTAYARGR
jgi:hypothetical protein